MTFRKLFVLIFIPSSLLISFNSFAQEKLDSIFFKDGSTVVVHISVNYKDHVEYTFPGEDMLNVMDKEDISRIVFRSGRQESYMKVPSSTPSSPSNDTVWMEIMEALSSNSTKPYEGIPQHLSSQGKVSLNIQCSGKIERLFNKELESFKKQYAEKFANEFNKRSYPLVRNTTFVTEGESEHVAILYLLDYDADDYEVYGYLELIRSDGSPLFRVYLDSEGKSTGTPSQIMLKSINNTISNMLRQLFPGV